MGTHISRVKSVDLDSWTDEQLQSILSWGNARANKYWEAKLASGHVPSEAKIENFIRTKYELKRWAMEGPRPDPSSLDVDGDDDIPLSLVKEKQVIERKESIRKASIGQSQAPRDILSLVEDDLAPAAATSPPRASSLGRPAPKISTKATPAAPRTTSPKDSLLGPDFMGGITAPARSSSASGLASPKSRSRPDLKQSILSLYATAPKPQPPPQPTQGPTADLEQAHSSSSALDDSFGSLAIANPPSSAQSTAADIFSTGSQAAPSSTRSTPPASTSLALGGLGEGGFFNAKPSQPPPPVAAPARETSSPLEFDAFGSFASPSISTPSATAAAAPKPPLVSSSAMGDLFDLDPGAHAAAPAPAMAGMASTSTDSVFNLSARQGKSIDLAPTNSVANATTFAGASISGADIWAGNEWAMPDTSSAAAPARKSSDLAKSPAANMGWGGSEPFSSTPILPGAGSGFKPTPKVAADEEFSGWASSTGPPAASTGASTSAGAASKPSGGFGGDEDLFSNVWQ